MQIASSRQEEKTTFNCGNKQVVSNNGEAVLDEQLNRGIISGQNGFEWVAFKTNKSPMKNPVAGYNSVFRAMPLEDVIRSLNMRTKDVVKFSLWWSSDDFRFAISLMETKTVETENVF
ncbi:11S globulin precursor [Tanacetum coccineum]